MARAGAAREREQTFQALFEQVQHGDASQRAAAGRQAKQEVADDSRSQEVAAPARHREEALQEQGSADREKAAAERQAEQEVAAVEAEWVTHAQALAAEQQDAQAEGEHSGPDSSGEPQPVGSAQVLIELGSSNSDGEAVAVPVASQEFQEASGMGQEDAADGEQCPGVISCAQCLRRVVGLQGRARGGADGARWAAGETGVQWVQGLRGICLHELVALHHSSARGSLSDEWSICIPADPAGCIVSCCCSLALCPCKAL